MTTTGLNILPLRDDDLLWLVYSNPRPIAPYANQYSRRAVCVAALDIASTKWEITHRFPKIDCTVRAFPGGTPYLTLEARNWQGHRFAKILIDDFVGWTWLSQ